MPGNRLALTVGIGRKDDAVGLFHRFGYITQAFSRFGVDLPEHFEIIIRHDRPVLGRQVANMTE